MAIVTTDDKHYKDIADKMRGNWQLVYDESGQYVKVRPSEMANICDLMVKDGVSNGYNKGKTDGKAEGITEGKEQGKQTAYDAFWDVYQQKISSRNSIECAKKLYQHQQMHRATSLYLRK